MKYVGRGQQSTGLPPLQNAHSAPTLQCTLEQSAPRLHIFTIVQFTAAQSNPLLCEACCCSAQFSVSSAVCGGNSMPGIAAWCWWCKGAWEKAAALAKIPDSTGAGPCEGASDDLEKDHHHGEATDYSSSGDSKMIYRFQEGIWIQN